MHTVLLCCALLWLYIDWFSISIRLTSLALWQSNDCPSASKATLMNMDIYFMWIHYERLHNHNKAKHNKTVCIFLGIYCKTLFESWKSGNPKKQGAMILWGVEIYTDTYAQRWLKTRKMVYSITSNLQANCHVELISKDINESGGSMFNTILYKKAQGQKHLGRWAITESKLPSCRKLKSVIQIGQPWTQNISNTGNNHGKIRH